VACWDANIAPFLRARGKAHASPFSGAIQNLQWQRTIKHSSSKLRLLNLLNLNKHFKIKKKILNGKSPQPLRSVALALYLHSGRAYGRCCSQTPGRGCRACQRWSGASEHRADTGCGKAGSGVPRRGGAPPTRTFMCSRHIDV